MTDLLIPGYSKPINPILTNPFDVFLNLRNLKGVNELPHISTSSQIQHSQSLLSCTHSAKHSNLPTTHCIISLSTGQAAQVRQIRWWMGQYGAPSAKPQKGWSNNAKVGHLDMGPYHHKQLKGKEKVTTVKKTVSKKTGKVHYSGTPALKSTQSSPHLVFLVFLQSAVAFDIDLPNSMSLNFGGWFPFSARRPV